MSRFRAWKRSSEMAKLRNPCFFNRTRVADFFSSYSLRGDIIHWIHLRSVMTPLSPPSFLRQFRAQKRITIDLLMRAHFAFHTLGAKDQKDPSSVGFLVLVMKSNEHEINNNARSIVICMMRFLKK